MARRNTEETLRRRLRRYAMAGNLQAAEALLVQHLNKHPEDKEATRELERLRKGLPLLATESAAQRRERESREACERIMSIISAHPENRLNSVPTVQLEDMQKTLRVSQRAMKEQDLPSLRSYCASLRKELRRRGMSKARRACIWLGGVTAVAAALTGLCFLTYRRACGLEEELRQALLHDTVERVTAVLPVANTGINRLFCSQMEDTVKAANQHLTAVNQLRKSLEKHIRRIESGRGTISAMRLSLRAEIEQGLSKRPADFEDLSKRWAALCQQEHAQLEEQRARLYQRLLAPIPPMPNLTGTPEQDTAALREHREEISKRSILYRHATASYKFPPELHTPIEERLRQIDDNLREISTYRELLNRLLYVRTYKQYRAALQSIAPKHYKPLFSLTRICPLLPDEENVKSLIQDPEGKTDDAETAAAVQTLLKNGPTFTPAYPATQAQVILMDDLFTAPSLRRVIYEITNSSGAVCYTEEPPTIDQQRRVHIKRSDLDPEATTGNRHVCWDDAADAWSRTIDARALVKAARLEKAGFFRECNIPELLSKVLNLESPSCPALAKACVYHKLLLLMSLHRHRLLTGARYSPTLRRHATSFRRIMQRHNIDLRPGCWLNKKQQTEAAEADFAEWFRNNSGADYLREMKQNFAPLMSVGVDFIGYANEQGKVVIFRNLPPETTIWYLSDDGLTAAPLSEQPEGVIPFSPIFTARHP